MLNLLVPSFKYRVTDQLNMAVCFKYLVKSDYNVRVNSGVHCTGQVTFYKVPDKHGILTLYTLHILLNLLIPSNMRSKSR